MTDSCEGSNELSISIKGDGFLTDVRISRIMLSGFI